MTESDYAATSNVISLNEDQGDAPDQNIRVKDNEKERVYFFSVISPWYALKDGLVGGLGLG